MKLLLIEDNKELANNIGSYLEKEGAVLEFASDYKSGINKLSGFKYDVILLDLMLPDGNGLDLLRFIKVENPDTGVLITSAKDALTDKVKGLELGADDYLSKPFHLPELSARVKAIYRRRKMGGEDIINLNEIHINTAKMEAKVNDQLLDLTRKEFEMLLYLVVNKNRVLTKQTIAEHLWGDHVDFLDSFDFVYQHIKNLRKKISQAGGKDYIQTLYGSGYKLNTSI